MDLDAAMRSGSASDTLAYDRDRTIHDYLDDAHDAAPEPIVTYDLGAQPVGGSLKRIFDLFGACAALVVLSPFLALIALIVKLQDGGPVLYSQKRVGFNGKSFYCLKFRSMRTDADKVLDRFLAQNPAAKAEWESKRKLKNDPRITCFGAFLRKMSFDEFPQLLNVIRGEMSMVGPRPIVKAEEVNYGSSLGHYYRCLPGLTGLWQVSGRSDTSYERRVALDRTYASHWSLFADCNILVRTIPAIFRRRGAY